MPHRAFGYVRHFSVSYVLVFIILVFFFRKNGDADEGRALCVGLLYNDVQVFVVEAVTLLRDAVQLRDDPAVDGGSVFLGVDVEEREGLMQLCGAIHKVNVILNLLEGFDDLVVLIPDLADELLENVFQCNDTLRAAEFVDDHGKVRFVLL